MGTPREDHIDAVNAAVAALARIATAVEATRSVTEVAQATTARAVGDSHSHAALEARADLADVTRLLDDIVSRLVNVEQGLEHYKAGI